VGTVRRGGCWEGRPLPDQAARAWDRPAGPGSRRPEWAGAGTARLRRGPRGERLGGQARDLPARAAARGGEGTAGPTRSGDGPARLQSARGCGLCQPSGVHARGACAPGTPPASARPGPRPPRQAGTATAGDLQGGVRPASWPRRHHGPRHTSGRSAALTRHRVGAHPAEASADGHRAALQASGRLARGKPPSPDPALGVRGSRRRRIATSWHAGLPATSGQETDYP
jgi:hypothetical protein